MAKRNGKKLANGQLLLERFWHLVVEEPVERQVDRDPDEHQSFMNSGLSSRLELSKPWWLKMTLYFEYLCLMT